MEGVNVSSRAFITKRFQGLGLIISTDNPTFLYTNGIVIEAIFLWSRCWIKFEWNKVIPQ